MKHENGRRKLSTYVEADVAEEFEALAQRRDRSVSKELLVAVRAHLKAARQDGKAAR